MTRQSDTTRAAAPAIPDAAYEAAAYEFERSRNLRAALAAAWPHLPARDDELDDDDRDAIIDLRYDEWRNSDEMRVWLGHDVSSRLAFHAGHAAGRKAGRAEGAAAERERWRHAIYANGLNVTVRPWLAGLLDTPAAATGEQPETPGNCEACWHLWSLHGQPFGCTVADSLTGATCGCEWTAPAAATGEQRS